MAAETSETRPASDLWNVPNQLTAARLVLSIVLFVLMSLHYWMASLVLFLVAAGTDWIDGYYARKYGQVTKLGRIFDPFVDKVLMCGSFVYLAAAYPASGIHPWMAVVIVSRELLVTALRSFIEQSGGDFSANFPGKLKMVFQCAAVVASLLALYWGAEPPDWLTWTVLGCAWVAVLSTLHSGWIYVAASFQYLRE